MTAHSTAKGIASLGRYGDDLIVHMNQEEVQGLQALAKQHGTSLTINPHTGMPEAFKLGGVFKALIPVAAGVMFPGFGASLFGGMEGIGAGILAGAATAAITGGNPLMGGITGALGGYSGAGLGNSLANLGATTPGGVTPTMVSNVTQTAAGAPLVGASNQFISPFTPNGIAGGAGLGVGTVGNAGIVGQSALANTAGNALTNQAMNAGLTGANTVANAGNVINAAQTAAPTYLDKLKAGTSKLFSKDGLSAYKASLPGSGGELTGVTKDATGNIISSTYNPVKPATNMDVFKKIGLPIGGALLGGVEESDLNPQVNLSDQEEKVYEQTGVDAAGKPTFGYIAKSAFNPYRTLNLSGPSPLNLGASLKLPATTGYAEGGIVQPTIQSGGIRDLYGSSDNQTQPLSADGFGLGRLSNLASAQEMQQAKTLGYADGGEVDPRPSLNLDNLPTLNINTGTNTPDIQHSDLYNRFFAQYGDKLNTPVMPNAAGIKSFGDYLDRARPLRNQFAEGGTVDPTPSLNLENLPTLNVITGSNTPAVAITTSSDNNDKHRGFFNNAGINFGYHGRDDSNRGGLFNNAGINFASDNRNGLYFRNIGGTQMAKGGYLDGAGDGMSDSIPATIEGKQPARLADGEFVVPADVVSHLGNGSSKAGSKRLYAMLDKVRHARTGTKKQGKQINPNKFLPA